MEDKVSSPYLANMCPQTGAGVSLAPLPPSAVEAAAAASQHHAHISESVMNQQSLFRTAAPTHSDLSASASIASDRSKKFPRIFGE